MSPWWPRVFLYLAVVTFCFEFAASEKSASDFATLARQAQQGRAPAAATGRSAQSTTPASPGALNHSVALPAGGALASVPRTGGPCEVICNSHGRPASCRLRILSLASQRFSAVQDACEHASKKVWQECSDCMGCSLDAEDCASISGDAAPELPKQAPAATYDCRERGAAGVGSEQEQWCCAHHQLMCHSGAITSSVGYDCAAELANWETGWSRRKKEWCCEHETLGCGDAAAPSGAEERPQTDRPGAAAAPGGERPAAALAPHGGAAEAAEDREVPSEATEASQSRHTIRDGYDCDAGLQGSETKWSAMKKSWCCEHEAKGCSGGAHTTSGPHDCRRGLFAWSESWSEQKKWWCCKNEGLGCAPAPSPADFAGESPRPTAGHKLRAGTEEPGAGRAGRAAGDIGVGLRRLLPAAAGRQEGPWWPWAPLAGSLLVVFLAGCLLHSACAGACCSRAYPTYQELPIMGFGE